MAYHGVLNIINFAFIINYTFCIKNKKIKKVTFTPITDETQQYLDVSLFEVTACNFGYVISSIPANLIANYVIDKYGVRMGM